MRNKEDELMRIRKSEKYLEICLLKRIADGCLSSAVAAFDAEYDQHWFGIISQLKQLL